MNLTIDPRASLTPENIKNKSNTANSKELQALRKSCREFEAIYINEMYKSMRKTVPDSGMFEKGVAEDVYKEMLDMELARQTAAGVGMGIGKAMYEQLQEKHFSDPKKVNEED